MTVSSTSNRSNQVATAGQVNFDYTFSCYDKTHMKVYVNAALKVVDVDYTINLTIKRVTFTVPPGAGAIIILLRGVPLTQLVNYTPHDSFPADTHEGALDLLCMMAQQFSESTDRSLRLPETSLQSGLIDKDLIANYFLKVNQIGTVFTFEATVPEGTDLGDYAKLSGRAGGQTLVGGSAATDILKLQGTSGNGTPTSPAIQLKVGNNGAVVAATILNNGNLEVAGQVKIAGGNPGAGKILTSNSVGLATWETVGSIINLVYPVGSIYVSTVSANPETLFGVGTWAAFGAGRVLVGLDAGQTEFDTVEETGGAKTHTLTGNEMPAHTHASSAQSAVDSRPVGTEALEAATTGSGTGIAGEGAAHDNLQPYIVVYMWKRTA